MPANNAEIGNVITHNHSLSCTHFTPLARLEAPTPRLMKKQRVVDMGSVVMTPRKLLMKKKDLLLLR